jgi:hypothetical protein
MSKSIRLGTLSAVALLALAAAGCGDFVRQGTSPALATVALLEGASGATPGTYSTTVSSDVITYVKKKVNGADVLVPTIFGDPGRATVSLAMKDPANTEPTAANTVTFTRFRVTYARADGRSTPNVDVPESFDSAVTFTVAPGSNSVAGFDLVRNVAKEQAPLVSLAANQDLITVIATVTFYGQDHAGHDVSAAGKIGITFGNFGDPD